MGYGRDGIFTHCPMMAEDAAILLGTLIRHYEVTCS